MLLFLARSWYLLICTILLNKHSTAQTQTRLRRSSVSLPGQGIVHRKGNLLKGRRGQSRTSPTDPLYTYDTSLSLIFVYLFGPQLCGAPVAHYYFYIFRTMTRVCVVCFINSILGNRYGLGVIPQIRGPGVAGSSPSTTSVAGYTCPLLFQSRIEIRFFSISRESRVENRKEKGNDGSVGAARPVGAHSDGPPNHFCAKSSESC